MLPPVGILAGLTDQALENLSRFGEFLTVGEGELVIRDGEVQDRLYVVVDGELKIYAMMSGEAMELAVVGSGECLGEVALFEPGPATATVQVFSAQATLWTLNRPALYEFVGLHAGSGGALLMGIAQCLSQRIRHSNALVAENHQGAAAHSTAGRMEPIRVAAPRKDEGGLFGLFKKKQAEETKVKISKEIKL
jgi:CRP-like cAMP-binding protein